MPRAGGAALLATAVVTLAAFDGGAYLLPAALTSLVLEIRAAERRADPGSDGSHGPDEAGGATSDDG